MPQFLGKVIIMGMFTNIYIDANLDLRELAIHLLPELPISKEITLVHASPDSLQYRFVGRDGRPMVYLSENAQVYLNEIGMASYRYELSATKGPQIQYMQDAYRQLSQHGCFPLAYQEVEQVTKVTFEPNDYLPDYSIVTRRMPVELLLWTNLTNRTLLRKLGRITGMDLSQDVYFAASYNETALAYVSKIDKYERQDPTSRYLGTTASYYIRVFGVDANPFLRRTERDALARRLYNSLLNDATIPVNIFEVIACKYSPFV